MLLTITWRRVMKMQWIAAAACATLLTAGCASSRSDSGMGNAKVAMAEPEILISQVSTVSEAARHITGGIPVKYQMRIENHAKESITLKRVEVQSIGAGAYDLSPTSHPFDKTIPPDGAAVVEFWAPANISDVTIVGANGPVTLRAVAQFDSPVGQFQHSWVQQVHDFGGR